MECEVNSTWIFSGPTITNGRSSAYGRAALRSRAAEQGVRLALLSDYYSARSSAPQHIVVVNYSGIDLERLPEGLRRLAQAWEE